MLLGASMVSVGVARTRAILVGGVHLRWKGDAMRSTTPMEGNPWPHDVVISVDNDFYRLLELLWIREAWGLLPAGDDLPPCSWTRLREPVIRMIVMPGKRRGRRSGRTS